MFARRAEAARAACKLAEAALEIQGIRGLRTGCTGRGILVCGVGARSCGRDADAEWGGSIPRPNAGCGCEKYEYGLEI